MKRKSPAQPALLKWIPLASLAGSLGITCVGALIGWSVWITKNVPQTSYVEELFAKNLKYVDAHEERLLKYIDDKSASVRKESFDHSDFNKSNMESEYKGLSAKIDMIILLINNNKIQKP